MKDVLVKNKIWRFSNRNFDVAQGRNHVAPSEEQTQYTVVNDAAKPSCSPLHHVKELKIIF